MQKKKKKKKKIERTYNAELAPDRVSFSEGVKIAIGDYESRDVHASMSTDVRHNEDESIRDAFQRSRKGVQRFLKIREKKIRESSEEDVEFETMDKLNYYKE